MQRFTVMPFFLTLALAAGCTLTAVRPYEPAAYLPYYVYAYGDGSCWADDVWYPACPWTVGPHVGYYAYDEGYYDWYPELRWHVRVTTPPPRHWQLRREHRHHYRYAPPPPRRPHHRHHR